MFDNSRSNNRITQAVWEAFTALEAAGHHPKICSPHHIKVGRFNFYPGRGTIIRDEESPQRVRGLAAFIELLAAARSSGPRPSLATSGGNSTPATANTTRLGLSLHQER